MVLETQTSNNLISLEELHTQTLASNTAPSFPFLSRILACRKTVSDVSPMYFVEFCKEDWYHFHLHLQKMEIRPQNTVYCHTVSPLTVTIWKSERQRQFALREGLSPPRGKQKKCLRWEINGELNTPLVAVGKYTYIYVHLPSTLPPPPPTYYELSHTVHIGGGGGRDRSRGGTALLTFALSSKLIYFRTNCLCMWGGGAHPLGQWLQHCTWPNCKTLSHQVSRGRSESLSAFQQGLHSWCLDPFFSSLTSSYFQCRVVGGTSRFLPPGASSFRPQQ